MVPVTLVLGSTAEVLSAYPTQVAPTDRGAVVASAHSAKMSAAEATAMASTATAGNRIGRNASACHAYGGNNDCGSV
jgi:hypothetical protein